MSGKTFKIFSPAVNQKSIEVTILHFGHGNIIIQIFQENGN